MAYFSNGSEGGGFQEVHCFNCANYRDKGDGRGEGCAVWDAHVLGGSEEMSRKNSPLHILIPRTPNGGNGECAMFLPTH